MRWEGDMEDMVLSSARARAVEAAAAGLAEKAEDDSSAAAATKGAAEASAAAVSRSTSAASVADWAASVNARVASACLSSGEDSTPETDEIQASRADEAELL